MGFVQISLDCPTCEEALKLARLGRQAGVHWLEAGTGLLLGSGLEGIRALRREFPDVPIIADTKNDGRRLSPEQMVRPGGGRRMR